ncbi:hypothetical protein L917_01816 [Phytophthora nicotianae]|uniref:ZSWIM1/3 RNaseH-like domain-containing protein n=1 Tax=Phytophthora nicotianae TaxID=4792 RepID=W2LYE8_PHYNI|nr:hypothetical protein L917_01816 [Phytophthora nicotianae]
MLSRHFNVDVQTQKSTIGVGRFCEMNAGNMAEFVADYESNQVQVVTFQTARQRRLFNATHNTNVNRYKLFSFAVHGVFGRGQFVHHALVRTERKENLALAVASFKKQNSDW